VNIEWENKRIIHLDDHEIVLTSAAKALRELRLVSTLKAIQILMTPLTYE